MSCDANTSMFLIHIRTLPGDLISVECQASDSIGDVKSKISIADPESYPIASRLQLSLLCSEAPTSDDGCTEEKLNSDASDKPAFEVVDSFLKDDETLVSLGVTDQDSSDSSYFSLVVSGEDPQEPTPAHASIEQSCFNFMLMSRGSPPGVHTLTHWVRGGVHSVQTNMQLGRIPNLSTQQRYRYAISTAQLSEERPSTWAVRMPSAGDVVVGLTARHDIQGCFNFTDSFFCGWGCEASNGGAAFTIHHGKRSHMPGLSVAHSPLASILFHYDPATRMLCIAHSASVAGSKVVMHCPHVPHSMCVNLAPSSSSSAAALVPAHVELRAATAEEVDAMSSALSASVSSVSNPNQ